MKVTPLEIPDVLLLEPDVIKDERGFFFESYNQQKIQLAIGQELNFVQDNHSKSTRGVIRGLHYQKKPRSQGKLVRVIYGEVFDVAVDIRKSSPTFGKWLGVTLSSDNRKQIWIPEGFAHGFLTLSEFSEFLYKTTDFYSPEYESSILWSDQDLNINWPYKNPFLSEKDKLAQSFKDAFF
jgi:dTDP-4-dehydrorhamnose 3,5-epimerase